MSFLETVIKEIRPSQKEEGEMNNMFLEIKKYISSKYNLESALMGSVAKHTFLKKNNDLDIFLFFDKTTTSEEMEKQALNIGENTFKHFGGSFEIEYASHPYTKGKIGNCKIEIVPCYRLKTINQMISAVDRTPFHTEYILKYLKKNQRTEVLLLKQFLRTIKCYGSDLKTKGFSGYLCELLIVKYKTFEGVLTKLSNLRENRIASLFELKDVKKLIKKFDSPFIFLDPVDNNRNVSASLGSEALLKASYYSRMYLQNPDKIYFDEKAFEKKTSTKKTLQTLLKNRCIYVLCFEKPTVVEDILFPQLEKFNNSLKNYIHSNAFFLNDYFFDVDEKNNLCIMGFDFSTDVLSFYVHRRGPDLFSGNQKIESFIEKHKSVYFSQGNCVCFEKRKITRACDLLHSIDSQKAKKQIAIPKEIEKKINKKFIVLDSSGIQKYVKLRKIDSKIICRNISGGKIIN